MWEKVAHEVEVVYGGYVDWEERFFNCPECNESIYECDWTDADFALNHYFDGHVVGYCPVCEEKLLREDEDE